MMDILKSLLIMGFLFLVVPLWVYIVFKAAGKGWIRGKTDQINNTLRRKITWQKEIENADQ